MVVLQKDAGAMSQHKKYAMPEPTREVIRSP
jgi:hypothetical protein